MNFSLFSRSAGIELLFFEREDDARSERVIRLDPSINRSYHYGTCSFPAHPGQIYGYRVEGPFDPLTDALLTLKSPP